MLKSEEIVNRWLSNYCWYSSFGYGQSVVHHIPYFFSQSGKAVIFLSGFSFPPETAGRQEVTKERSSGPLGLGPRSPPDSRNSPSGAERSGAARRPPHLCSRRAPARARPRHRPAPGPAPAPSPSRPGPAAGLRVRARPGRLCVRSERGGRRAPRAPRGAGARRERRKRAAAGRGRTVLYVTWSRLHRARGRRRRRPGLGVGSVCRLCASVPGSLWPWESPSHHLSPVRLSCSASKQDECKTKRNKNYSERVLRSPQASAVLGPLGEGKACVLVPF